ncbi:MAG: hypothetical protein KAT77_00270 [Nanoarchaeota archaeon]|nr:hypothetical protein [Nanoarchaeota archaeon]
MNLLSFIGYCIGMTQEVRTELSDVFEDEAVVGKKEHVPANPWVSMSYAIHAPFMIATPGTEEKHYIVFEGEGILFRVNNQNLFAMLEEGDKVMVKYRRLTNYIHDYMPPNFSSKKLLGSTSENIFDSAEKRD